MQTDPIILIGLICFLVGFFIGAAPRKRETELSNTHKTILIVAVVLSVFIGTMYFLKQLFLKWKQKICTSRK